MLSSKEAAIFVVISFLLVVLVFSLYFMPHMQETKAAQSCVSVGKGSQSGLEYARCCDTQTDEEGIGITWCTICQMDPSGDVHDCGPRYQLGEGPVNPTVPPTNEQPPPPQPPKSALPPSTICPDGSAPDANGNCPASATNQQVTPDQNLASNNNNNNNNNPQGQQQHHKATNLLGQESTSKKDNGGGPDQGTARSPSS